MGDLQRLQVLLGNEDELCAHIEHWEWCEATLRELEDCDCGLTEAREIIAKLVEESK